MNDTAIAKKMPKNKSRTNLNRDNQFPKSYTPPPLQDFFFKLQFYY